MKNNRNNNLRHSLAIFAIAMTSISMAQGKGRDLFSNEEVARVYSLQTGRTTIVDRETHLFNPKVMLFPGGPALPGEAPISLRFRDESLDHPDGGGNDPGIGSIIGSDNRVRYTNTDDYPWSTQCQIVTNYTDGTSDQGSGTIIGSKYVITAYHVVSDTGKKASSIQVIPGMDDGDKPFGTKWASEFMYWGTDDNDDMAIIKLTSSVSGSTGTLGLAAWSDNDGKTMNLAGYPGDKGGDQLWYDNDPCTDQTTNYLWYKVDTFSGQSGSGVYRIVSGSRYVVGAHNGSGTHSGETQNLAVRVTNGKFDDIVDYIS